ncbi:hypothetical protein PU629_09085 [Pullulanibacillus sp. KACC 23026]|uniref:hypothetical protein n=1 Tax=Pullulanibacillus sp. KACC 23026 TaxID=3028315 RepID=UPI0023B1E0B6|nr:hypothetical protein [Pullulanibacillus sp. KACC 23026]WEG14489.1 hypothetical protein PU629_09085 [Pullulanibacillus sp. KACC 23026]
MEWFNSNKLPLLMIPNRRKQIKNYYIGRGTGRYMFWEFNNPASETVGENTEELLSKVRIEGKSIKEIWDLIEIDVFY